MVRDTESITTHFEFPLGAPMTRRLARAAYVVTIAFLGVVALGVVVYSAMRSLAIGALVLGISGAGVFVAASLLRLWLGALVSLSRIEEQSEEIAEQVAGIALNTAPLAEPARSARIERSTD